MKNHFLHTCLKTTVDPFLGQINIMKINSGILKVNQDVTISNKGDNKR